MRRLTFWMLIVLVATLAFAGVLPHSHASDQASQHCAFCLAHRSPALAVTPNAASVSARVLVGVLPLHRSLFAPSSLLPAAFARAPPAHS